jgi:anti-sigma B factor antagonist
MDDRATGVAAAASPTRNFEVFSEALGPGRCRIRCKGELDLATNPEFAETLMGTVGRGERVLVDLSETTYIDSTGIGTLVAAWRSLNGDAEAGAIVVLATEPAVTRILELTGVGAWLRISSDEAEALRLLDQP